LLRAVPRGAPVSQFKCVTDFGFTSRLKIKKTDDFSSVFNFRKRIAGQFLVIHYMPNTLEHARVGLIVGKKTARRAVDRNYMKRVLRELFRHEQNALGGVDILVRPQKLYTHENFAQIKAEFVQLINKLCERTNSKKT
jgi:ribonuclease P protein component